MPVTIPENRRPTPPGEMLIEEFLKPMNISQTAFAKHIGVSYVRLNEIVNGRRAVTPDTAVRFARALGTSPQFWMNGQMAVDLYDTMHADRKLAKIRPIAVSGTTLFKTVRGEPNVRPARERIGAARERA